MKGNVIVLIFLLSGVGFMGCAGNSVLNPRSIASVGAPNTADMTSLSADQFCRLENIATLTAAQNVEKKYDELLQSNPTKMDDEIFTTERKTKIRSIFDAAKTAHLRFLTDLTLKTNSALLPQMIARVQATDIVMSVHASANGPAEYGARVLLRATAKNPDLILAPGIALFADEAPAALFFVFLHELSHPIDPGVYPVPRTGASDSPWTRAVRCLRSPESVAARVGDIHCFQTQAARFLQLGDLKNQSYCAQTAKGLIDNPDFAQNGPSCNCPAPQGTEAFADWLAAEVLASTHIYETAAAFAWPCSAYLSLRERNVDLLAMPSGKSILAEIANADVHPLMKDRLERIMFAQPNLRRRLLDRMGFDSPQAQPNPTPLAPHETAIYCPF